MIVDHEILLEVSVFALISSPSYFLLFRRVLANVLAVRVSDRVYAQRLVILLSFAPVVYVKPEQGHPLNVLSICQIGEK